MAEGKAYVHFYNKGVFSGCIWAFLHTFVTDKPY